MPRAMMRSRLFFCLFLAACAKDGIGLQHLGNQAPDAAIVNDSLDAGAKLPDSGVVTLPDAGAPLDAGDPLASPFLQARGVMHVHSVFSHDACDNDPMPGGVRNQPCWSDLRAAVCLVKLDFVGLTDHPAHMKEHPMADELLYDGSKGDQLIFENGVVAANRLRCDDGRTVLITEGFEAEHTLPIGFSSQPATDAEYGDLLDARPIGDVQAMVAQLKGHGAVISSAHSEETNVSAATLVASGVDAMEWYNPHGNFKTIFGDQTGTSIGLGALDALSLLGKMSPFMTGASSGAHPDLVLLVLLPHWPQAGFDKWREVQRSRTVTGMLGSDVHQNVSIKPLCTGSLTVPCQLAAAGSPDKQKALALLISGGLIVMADERRLDAYERIFRWVENRMLVTEYTTTGIKDALRAGRSYGLFSVFGDPLGFRFAGQQGSTLLEMGARAAGPVTLTVRAPVGAGQLTGAPISAADSTKAQVRVSLYLTTSHETKLVQESALLGGTFTFTATEPGAYHVEVWTKPKHLASALGSQAGLADTEYLWLITTPIRVLP